MEKNNTRHVLIKAGAKAMLAKSYHSVGIQEVLAAVDVPKGSFYHYFASKEAFGIAIVIYYGEQLATAIRTKLNEGQSSPRERIRQYFKGIRDYYAKNGVGRGCLVAKLATEVADPGDGLRQELKRQFDQWTQLFAECIREGQIAGEIVDEPSAEILAEFLYISWEGALVRMQVNDDLNPLDIFIRYAIDRILPLPPQVNNA